MITIFDRERIAPKQLPASRFPEWADRYICDACGRDVTSRIHYVRGHSGGPNVGPESFICGCGARHSSGLKEWDHLHPFTRRKRMEGLMWAPVLLIVPVILLALLVRAAAHHQSVSLWALVCAGALIAIPFEIFGLFAISDVPSIVASIWRTRIAKSR
jgi:hypothetical protein